MLQKSGGRVTIFVINIFLIIRLPKIYTYTRDTVNRGKLNTRILFYIIIVYISLYRML